MLWYCSCMAPKEKRWLTATQRWLVVGMNFPGRFQLLRGFFWRHDKMTKNTIYEEHGDQPNIWHMNFGKSVALSRYEKMCVLHVRKKLSRLQLGSQSDEHGWLVMHSLYHLGPVWYRWLGSQARCDAGWAIQVQGWYNRLVWITDWFGLLPG